MKETKEIINYLKDELEATMTSIEEVSNSVQQGEDGEYDLWIEAFTEKQNILIDFINQLSYWKNFYSVVSKSELDDPSHTLDFTREAIERLEISDPAVFLEARRNSK